MAHFSQTTLGLAGAILPCSITTLGPHKAGHLEATGNFGENFSLSASCIEVENWAHLSVPFYA